MLVGCPECGCRLGHVQWLCAACMHRKLQHAAAEASCFRAAPVGRAGTASTEMLRALHTLVDLVFISQIHWHLLRMKAALLPPMVLSASMQAAASPHWGGANSCRQPTNAAPAEAGLELSLKARSPHTHQLTLHSELAGTRDAGLCDQAVC